MSEKAHMGRPRWLRREWRWGPPNRRCLIVRACNYLSMSEAVRAMVKHYYEVVLSTCQRQA